jgi:putative nucleotidyltransferase with HDIG domain
MRRAQEKLREQFRHLTTLPTLPEIAVRCMRMVNDPRSAAQEVAAIIGQDISLSSKVLRLANSAFYGMPGKISSVDRAIVLLGFKTITTIVLSVTVFDLFPENKMSRRLFDRKAFWLHSLSCALIAKYLAARVKRRFLVDPEEAFCSGLLHDIGKVVLEQYLHEKFHAALKAARAEKIPLYQAEVSTLGFSHADVAAWLTDGWGLPAAIAQPLACHHEPHSSTERADASGLCHVADWLCYQIGMVIDPSYAAPEPEGDLIPLFEISPAMIEELKEKIPPEINSSLIATSFTQDNTCHSTASSPLS